MTLQIPKVIPHDWNRLRVIIDKLKHLSLGINSSPTFTELTLTDLTASRIIATDASKVLVSLASPLIVAEGGTGLATITDGGLLLGSGTGAITPLAQATNGQLPIGSTGADPVLATITGTSNQITVSNAAGSITLSLPQDYHTGASPTLAGLTLTNAAVIGSNSVVFQPNTDSTTFLQVLDADGGTPIFNIDTTNERVSIGTGAPTYQFHTSKSGIARWMIEDTATNNVAIYFSGTDMYFWRTGDMFFFRNPSGGVFSINPGGVEKFRFTGSTGRFGLGDNNPETLMEMTSTVPYLTLHNSTHEDTDGGRESRLNFKGEQSGGEEKTLARIEIGHDGTGDDEKGYFDIFINDGDDGDSPTKILRIESRGLFTDRWLEDSRNTFLGIDVCGSGNLTTGGLWNVGIGNKVFEDITTGAVDTMIGYRAGLNITDGNNNTGVGYDVLYMTTTGGGNTAIGISAGSSGNGSDSVFLGKRAGYYETGSNKLFIDNAPRANEADGRVKALIYGMFAAATANQTLTINAVLDVSENIQIDSTQVISNRVIDARCDDALNSGDATTDGVIDSLRDAMITHGLIAAA